jgi:hypothetical protein
MREATRIAEDLRAQGKKVYGLSLDGYVGGRVRWIFAASEDKASRVFPAMFPETPRNSNAIRESLEGVAIPGLSLASVFALALLAVAWWRARRTNSKSEGAT